jgi:uncharacterized protein (DUF1810 family)
MSDSPSLERFLQAQAPVYESALAELQAGQKRSHWIWFVFPQLRGLGHSEATLYYGITSRAEAKAYLEHPVLGARLRECTEALLTGATKSARQILGSPDDLKLQSSMTLFREVAAADDDTFGRALDRFFYGEPDAKTLSMLASEGPSPA